MTNKNSETRNPIFWGLIAVVLGTALWIWGAIRVDCSGPNCWHGSGFLIVSGITLVLGGIASWFLFGSRK